MSKVNALGYSSWEYTSIMKASLGTSQLSLELSWENILQEWGPLGTDSLQSRTEIHEVFDTIV